MPSLITAKRKGMTKSDLLMQMQSDILELNVGKFCFVVNRMSFVKNEKKINKFCFLTEKNGLTIKRQLLWELHSLLV